MKWISLYKKKKREDRSSSPGPSDAEEEAEQREARKRRASSSGRPSLDQWFEARRRRTSICEADTTTTARLQVSKAGVTTLINKTYVVIKHLGKGTYGHVKLAFNLNDKKLYAIKACKKSQLGCPTLLQTSKKTSTRYGNFRLRRSSTATASGLERQQQSDPNPRSGMSASTTGNSVKPSACSLPLPVNVEDPSTASVGSLDRRLSGMAAGPSGFTFGAVSAPSGVWKAREWGSASAPIAGPNDMRRAFEQIKAEQFVREIAIMKRLSHPNVVRLVEVIDDPASDNLLLVMEYVEGDSLEARQLDTTHWEKVPELEVWKRARDVIQGLDYLHFQGVIHGDLKPANLMMDNNTRTVKIVDFGSSVFSSNGSLAGTGVAMGQFDVGRMMGVSASTPAFRSPESLQSGYRPSFEQDMWAFGVTLYMWVFGELPFAGAAPFMVYESIRRGDLRLPSHTRVSEELSSLLLSLLEKSPAQRLDIMAALQHPWTTGTGTALMPMIPRVAHGGGSGSGGSCGPSVLESLQEGGDERIDSAEAAGFNSEPLPWVRQPLWGAAGQGGSAWQGGALAWRQAGLAETLKANAAQQRRPPPPRQCSSSVRNVPMACRGGQRLRPSPALRPLPEVLEARLPLEAVSDPLFVVKSSGERGEEDAREGLARHMDVDACEAGPSLDAPPLSGGAPSASVSFFPAHAPLRSRKLTQEELDEAVNRSNGGVLVMDAMGSVFEEIRYSAGENIIAAGDPMEYVYLITQGEVEIYHEVPPEAKSMEPGLLTFPIIAGLRHCGDASAGGSWASQGRRESGLETDDEDFLSGAASHHMLSKSSTHSGDLPSHGSPSLIQQTCSRFSYRAFAAVTSPSVSGGGAAYPLVGEAEGGNVALGSLATSPCVVLTVKGPGDSLGMVQLEEPTEGGPQPMWRASVRVRGEAVVVVLRARIAGLRQLVGLHPELAVAVRNIVVQQDTDHKVDEALRQLDILGMCKQRGMG